MVTTLLLIGTALYALIAIAAIAFSWIEQDDVAPLERAAWSAGIGLFWPVSVPVMILIVVVAHRQGFR